MTPRDSESATSYLVRLQNGLVVQMSREQYEAMWKGVDPLACKVLGAPSAPKGWEWKGLSYEC